MIELERHIEILLLNNDCVIVPDLGGFMAHYTEAHYDDSDQMYLPPMRTLGFNPALKMNDSLLAQSYIEAYDISYPEAIHRIEEEVNELRQHIDNQGYYELNDIGVLRINEYGNYEFEPCEAGILTPSLYGLSTVEIEPLDAQKPATVQAEVKPLKVEKTKEKAEEKTAKQVDINTPLYITGERDKHIHISVNALRNVAAAVIAIVLFFTFSTPLNNGMVEETSMLNIDTDMLTKIMPVASVQGVNEPQTVKKIETTVASAENTTANAEKPVTDAGKEKPLVKEVPAATQNVASALPVIAPEKRTFYTLVLASQVSKTNAEVYVEKLQKAGFQEAKVYTKGKSNRVIYNQYKTEAEAYSALNKLHEHAEFKEAWVYEVK